MSLRNFSWDYRVIILESILMSHHAWTIEEARPVVMEMVHNFLHLLYNDQNMVAYAKYIKTDAKGAAGKSGS
jgi:hypothetical protein